MARRELKKLGKFIGLYGAYVIFLHVVPGPWYGDAQERRTIDGWTAMHAVWGAIAQKMGLSLQQILILSTFNEMAEYVLRERGSRLLWGEPETLPNVGVDFLATAAGHYLASKV